MSTSHPVFPPQLVCNPAADVQWAPSLVSRTDREQRQGHHAQVIWLTGLSGAGKTTIASRLEQLLHARGLRTYWLDGDNVRHGLCSDLRFSDQDRHENLRRVAETSRLLLDAGIVVIASFISPLRADRDMVRGIVGTDDFMEVYCDSPLSVCEQRDPKGMYARARAGEIQRFTGVSAPYEPPLSPAVRLDTAHGDPDSLVATLAHAVAHRTLISDPQ